MVVVVMSSRTELHDDVVDVRSFSALDVAEINGCRRHCRSRRQMFDDVNLVDCCDDDHEDNGFYVNYV